MPAYKYNWSELKLEFFKSSEDHARGFLESKYSYYSGAMARMSRGWAVEKQNFQAGIIQEALIQARGEHGARYAMALHDFVENAFLKPINENLESLTIYERVLIWKVLMTLNGKPTSIKPGPATTYGTTLPPMIPEVDEEHEAEIERILRMNGLMA